MKEKHSRRIEQWVIHTWWVVVFFIICFAFYERAIYHHGLAYEQLDGQLSHLTEEKRQALTLQHELKLQINSQSDPAWIELTLMRELGLLPEGQTKVYFMPSG